MDLNCLNLNHAAKIACQEDWFVFGNGHLDWSCPAPLMKHRITCEEIKFYEWIDSINKDIECAFSTLKHGFAILKMESGQEQCDQVWRTFYALHYRSLTIDELDKCWIKGASI